MDRIIQKIVGQGDVIRLFLKYPEREFTFLEVSKESGTPYATTWRTIRLLSDAGVVLVRKIGNYNLCKLNKKSPYLSEIKKALKVETSPHRAALRMFTSRIRKIPEIRRAILFGSVSKGEEELKSDVDVALIVSRKNKKVEKLIDKYAKEVLESSRINIVPLLLNSREMTEDKEFKKELEGGEIIYERNH